MEQIYKEWSCCNLLHQIQMHKQVYLEPKSAADHQLVMNSYYSDIFEDGCQGAILMGVCRGKISEGLDFSDNAARCVIIVGIPYP